MKMKNKKDKLFHKSIKYTINSPLGIEEAKNWVPLFLDNNYIRAKQKMSETLMDIDLITACVDYFVRNHFDFVDKIYCDLNTSCDIKVTFKEVPEDENKIKHFNMVLFSLFVQHGSLFGVTEELVDEINIEYFCQSAERTLDKFQKIVDSFDGMDIGEVIENYDDIEGYPPDEIFYFLDVFKNNILDSYLESTFSDEKSRKDFLEGKF